ncbi:MAG TPA: hypothetical protein VGX23_31505 [Actinocrinis sp.]|nr:hypothetical protein [Actinocrinis sp.]
MTSIVIAFIGAAASVVAAIVAACYAKSTQRNDAEAQRARELKSRISERKYELYKPMIELFGDILDSTKTAGMAERAAEIQAKFADFSTWVNIYGSDGAIVAFHNFKQAAFHPPLPSLVATRLFADFLLEALPPRRLDCTMARHPQRHRGAATAVGRASAGDELCGRPELNPRDHHATDCSGWLLKCLGPGCTRVAHEGCTGLLARYNPHEYLQVKRGSGLSSILCASSVSAGQDVS